MDADQQVLKSLLIAYEQGDREGFDLAVSRLVLERWGADDNEPYLRGYTLAELRAMVDDYAYLVPRFLAQGQITLLHSEPKKGKSTALISGIMESQQSAHWWGERVHRPFSVQYLTEETSAPNLVAEMEVGSYRADGDSPDSVIMYPITHVRGAPGIDRLLAGVIENWNIIGDKPDVLVMDTAQAWLGITTQGSSDGGYTEVLNAYAKLKVLFIEHPTLALCLVMHSAKGKNRTWADVVSGVIGSTAWAAQADIPAMLIRGDGSADVDIRVRPRGGGDRHTFELTRDPDTGLYAPRES